MGSPTFPSTPGVLLVNGPASPKTQMDRDLEIGRLLNGLPSVLLRLYRIVDGVTVGRTWQGKIPDEWKVPETKVAMRPTGGGAVRHGQDLCLSLFIPRPLLSPGPHDWPTLYESFHSVLGRFLLMIGRESIMQAHCGDPCSNSPASRRGHESLCFMDPVRGDLMIGGAKVLGGALSIGRSGILYQGSMQIPGFDPSVLSGLFEEWYRSEGREKIDEVLLVIRREA